MTVLPLVSTAAVIGTVSCFTATGFLSGTGLGLATGADTIVFGFATLADTVGAAADGSVADSILGATGAGLGGVGAAFSATDKDFFSAAGTAEEDRVVAGFASAATGAGGDFATTAGLSDSEAIVGIIVVAAAAALPSLIDGLTADLLTPALRGAPPAGLSLRSISSSRAYSLRLCCDAQYKGLFAKASVFVQCSKNSGDVRDEPGSPRVERC